MQLNMHWPRTSCAVFRNRDIDSQNLIDFGSRFGELTVHPFAPKDKDVPVLIKFRNDETNPPFRTDVWHSDETFRKEPPKATILVAKEVPAIGGDTMFASMAAAFDGLSERMQRFISGLEAVHDLKPFRELFDDSEADRQKCAALGAHLSAGHPSGRARSPELAAKCCSSIRNSRSACKSMDERESKARWKSCISRR